MNIVNAFLCIILGLFTSLLIGLIIVPYFKKIKINQKVSHLINKRHLAKDGTPTMGGIIFVLGTIISLLILYLFKKIKLSYNLGIIIISFVSYALLGFTDDYIKIRFKNNKGLSILTKFFIQLIIGIILFYLYLIAGNNTILDFYLFKLDLKSLYGLFLLFLIVGSSNAVNITDGLDGLAGGLCFISFITYGIISLRSTYIIGYYEIFIFCFILAGALLGFLFFNFYPAKIFMGDLGSLSLGATLACVTIVLKKELSLIFIGFIFIIETLSSFIQIISIRYLNKKVFLKSPLHHHFEMLSYKETEIVKLFYLIELVISLIVIVFCLFK